MNTPTTICKKCTNFINLEPSSERSDCWYNHLCKAHPNEKGVDPVTGRERYVIVNDFGRRVFTDNEYQFCRDINDGNCPKFVYRELAELTLTTSDTD